MSAPAGSNRLPQLAIDIRAEHGEARAAIESAAEHACAAGRALIEAKALLRHGEWLPWLRDQCGLPKRTAQLYMSVARCIDDLGLKSATVAHLGLRVLGQVASGERITLPFAIDSFADCDAEGRRSWYLFALFGVAIEHVQWIARRPFNDPDEWLGEEGSKYRRGFGWRDPAPEFCAAWREFRDQRRNLSELEIIKRLNARAA